MQQEKTVIFMGPQGSGKGTQAKLLKQYLEEHNPGLSIIHFDTGQHFRKFMSTPGFTTDRIKESINRGDLQPDWLPNWLFATELIDGMSEHTQILIDGIPRSVGQAKVVDEILSYFNREVIDVIVIEVSESLSIERLIPRGRADDTREAISYRLKQYHETTVPVINYYQHQSPKYRVHRIDGGQHIEKVTKDIFTALNLVKE